MTTYRCPLHQEIQRDRPATCPKCGLRLEPREVPESTTGAKQGRNEPIRDK
jgi:Cu+-exporting ATPase